MSHHINQLYTPIKKIRFQTPVASDTQTKSLPVCPSNLYKTKFYATIKKKKSRLGDLYNITKASDSIVYVCLCLCSWMPSC